MKLSRTVVTFCVALSAFLAVGGGVAMLLVPAAPAAPRRADLAATSTAPPAGETTATDTPSGYAFVADAPTIPRPGQPSRIVIAAIGLDARVAEVGITLENGKPVWETAAFAVGYYRGTALPGGLGNAVMVGHISSPVSKKGEVFKRLPELRIGDQVDIYLGEKRIAYEVAEVRVVKPTAVQVMAPTPDATLTLITCYPDRDYSRRLVVVGKLAESPS